MTDNPDNNKNPNKEHNLGALYRGLYQNGLYTSSFQDFVNKFSNEDNRKLLHEGLVQQGLYTGDIDAFSNKFFDQPVEYFKDYNQSGRYIDPEIQEYNGKKVEGYFQSIAQGWTSGKYRSDAVDETTELFMGGGGLDEKEYDEFVNAVIKSDATGNIEELNNWSKSFQKYRDKGNNVAMSILMAINEEGVDGFAGVATQSVRGTAPYFGSEDAQKAGTSLAVPAGAASWYTGIGGAAITLGAYMAGSNALSETMIRFQDGIKKELVKRNKDFNSSSVRELLSDQAFYRSLRNRSLAAGASIGIIEGTFSALGGTAVSKTAKAVNTAFKNTNRILAKTAVGVSTGVVGGSIEAAGGGLGEAVAGKITGEDVTELDIITESFAGLGGAPAQIAASSTSILTQGKYKINGKEVSSAQMKDVVNSATEEQLAAMDIEVQNDKGFSDYMLGKRDDVALKNEINARITDKNDRQQIFNLEKQRKRFEKGKTQFAKSQLAAIDAEIKEISDKYSTKGRLSSEAKRIKARQEKINRAIEQRNISATERFAKEEGGKVGLKTKSFDTTKDFAKSITEDNISLNKEQQSKINQIGGFVYNGTIYINKEVAAKTGNINVGAHEVLHPILNTRIGSVADQAKLVDQFKNQLTTRQIKQMDTELMKRYGRTDIATEYLTVFSDSVRAGKIKLNDSIYQKIGNIIVNILKPLGFTKIGFEDGKSVYNFMREYNKSIEKGALTERAISAIGEIDPEDSNLVQLSLSPEKSLEVNKAYEEQGLAASFDILEELKPTAEALAKRYSKRPNYDQLKDILVDEILTGKRGMLEVMIDYDKKVKEGRQMGELSGYLNNSFSTKKGFKKYIEIADRILGKGEESQFMTRIDDPEVAQQLQAEPDVETTRKPQPKKLDPRDMLKTPGAKQAYNDAINIDNLTLENISFKKLKGQATEITAEEFGIPVNKVKNPAANLGKKDLINTSKAIFDRINDIKKLLPKGAVLEAATEALIGTSTGIPKSLLDVFYTKQNRVTKGAGIYPHTLNKLTNSDMLQALGIDDEGAPIKGLSGRSKEAQRQKSLIALLDKIISNTAVREKLKKADISENIIQDVRAGTSDVQLSVMDKSIADEFGQGDSYILPDSLEAVDNYVNYIANKIIPAFAKHPGLLSAGEFVNGLKIKDSSLRAYLRAKLKDLDFVRGKYPKRDFASYVGKTTKDINKNKSKIKEYNKQAGINFKAFWESINDLLTEDPTALGPVLVFLKNSVNSKSHPHRGGAQFVSYDTKNTGKVYLEHALQNVAAYRTLIRSIMDPKQDFSKTFNALEKNYKLIGLSYKDNLKLDKAGLKNEMSLDGKWNIFDNNWWERYFNDAVFEQGGINTEDLLWLPTNKTFLQEFNINSQGVSTSEQLQLSIAETEENALMAKAIRTARLKNKPKKGISVYDFDDTLAFSKSQVIVNKDGKTFKINAAQFAKQGETLLSEGAEFDFSEFNKVVKGQPGPLIPRIQKAIDKFGNKNIFILTARPVASENAIHAFMKGLGIDIPRANITGLANSTAKAKADWMVGKVAEGYNDFYFVDDAIKNVQAVKNVLETFDINSKVQQAIVQTSLSAEFNQIIDQTKGVGAEKVFSDAAAKSRGRSQNKFKFFLPPSAEDFEGLIYSFLGKGKQGEKQLKFFQDNLIRPFFTAIEEINSAKQVYASNYRELNKHYKDVSKMLSKKTDYNNFSFDAAIRVYLWDKLGYKIPGISKTDQSRLSNIVEKDTDLKGYAEILNRVTGSNFPTPSESWVVGSIASDINDITNNVGRKEYLSKFIENKNEIFSKDNLNKIEAVYGGNFREALEDILFRMENGTNRTTGNNKIVNSFMNWVNNSVGSIMFLNFRSAALQTISLFNFINWNDNNPFKFGKAILNTKQYSKDFAFIFNSDMLKQRRKGLQTDVNSAEIAKAMDSSADRPKAILNYVLSKGFAPTQAADSFAIAAGGAAFYRNRINTYIKQGLSIKEAEARAFKDFAETSEKSQQSSNPAMVSMQQAGPLGRLILAFQNTPMQYTRLIKKSFLDLKNNRGDWKSNVSKIIYYGIAQNILFSTLQNALFGIMFDDEEEIDFDKKKSRAINSSIDTILRGSGIYGAAVATIKNMIMRFMYESGKDSNPDYTYVLLEGLNLSPPIGSKARKLYSATQSYKFDRDLMSEKGFKLDNPAYLAGGNVVSATTNIPLDRAFTIINNVREAANSENQAWQRTAMALGWNTWDVGVDPYKSDKPKRKKIKRDVPKRKVPKR